MRVRLRPMPTAAELAALYAVPHQHRKWLDHIVRVNVTTEVTSLFVPPGGTVVDLSCGDATIARRLAEESGGALILGDFAAGYPITGPIEETVEGLRWKQASMFVLSETLEHLDDPDAVLKQIRDKCDHLVVSTPDGETDPSRNPEHVWGWDSEEVGAMLVAADFEPLAYTLLDLRPAGFEYAFQMWVCR